MSRPLDKFSEFPRHRRGPLPQLAVIPFGADLEGQFLRSRGWLASSNLLLHIGIIVTIFGLLPAWA